MGTISQQEVYRTIQPDGSIAITTTKTTVQQRTHVIPPAGGEGAQISYPWKSSTFWAVSILRIVQITMGIVIIGCVVGPLGFQAAYLGTLVGQQYVMATAGIGAAVALGFLLASFFIVPRDEQIWRTFNYADLGCNIFAVILYIPAFGLEAWYASGTWMPNCNQIVTNQVVQHCWVVPAWIAAVILGFVCLILHGVSVILAFRRLHANQLSQF